MWRERGGGAGRGQDVGLVRAVSAQAVQRESPGQGQSRSDSAGHVLPRHAQLSKSRGHDGESRTAIGPSHIRCSNLRLRSVECVCE